MSTTLGPSAVALKEGDLAPLNVNRRETHVSPNIPPRKLQGALRSYAAHVRPHEVLFLYDDSAFKWDAAVGFLLTASSLLWRNAFEAPHEIALRDIKKVETRQKFLRFQLIINGEPISCEPRLARAFADWFTKMERRRSV